MKFSPPKIKYSSNWLQDKIVVFFIFKVFFFYFKNLLNQSENDFPLKILIVNNKF